MGARLTPLTGAIIAGGHATRMNGVAKGLLEVGGVRIIDRVAHALRPLVHTLMIATNAPDGASWLPGARTVPDVLSGGGSAAGIHATLTASATPVLAIAWDLPFVTAELLHVIASRVTPDTDVVACAGPHGGDAEPLCAWYAPACAPAIEAAWREGDRSMHGLLSRVRTVIVSAGDVATCGAPTRLFFNVNTPDDLVTARRMAEEDA